MEQSLTVNPKPKIISTAPLIKSALADYRQHWKKFAYLLLLPLVLSYLGSLISFATGKFSGPMPAILITSVLSLILTFAIVVIFIIIYVRAYAAQFLLVEDLSQTVDWDNLRNWYRRAAPYFWTVVAISLVYGLLALIGLVLLIIPGIIFGVYYCFAIYAALFENHKFEGSFGRSRELVRGYWWAVFGRFLAGGALVYIAYVIIGGLYAGLIWLIAFALHFQSSKDLFTLMYNLLSVFVGLAVGPLSVIYTYKIYQSLKEIKGASAE